MSHCSVKMIRQNLSDGKKRQASQCKTPQSSVWIEKCLVSYSVNKVLHDRRIRNWDAVLNLCGFVFFLHWHIEQDISFIIDKNTEE